MLEIFDLSLLFKNTNTSVTAILLLIILVALIHQFYISEQDSNKLKKKKIDAVYSFREQLKEYYYLIMSWQSYLYLSGKTDNTFNFGHSLIDAKDTVEKLNIKKIEFAKVYKRAIPYMSMSQVDSKLMTDFVRLLHLTKEQIVCGVKGEKLSFSNYADQKLLNDGNNFDWLEENYKKVIKVVDSKLGRF